MAVTVMSAPSRLQLIEVARKSILNEGSKFSLTSITKELNCSRSYVRRFFPCKADLISAAFGGSAEESVEQPAHGVAGKNRRSERLDDRDDWVMRRFRVFERAIATLENEIEVVRKGNADSVADLERRLVTQVSEKRISESQPCVPSPSSPEVASLTQVSNEHDTAAYSVARRISKASVGPYSRENSSLVSELPPIFRGAGVDDEELLVGPASAHDFHIEDPIFIAAPPSEPVRKDGWKEIVVFGLTAFAAALLLAIIVMAFTNGAGASYGPSSEIKKTVEQQQKPIGVKQVQFATGGSGSESHLVINATGSAGPDFGSKSLAAKNLGLENFDIGRVTLNEAAGVKPDTKVKFALAYLKGDGVRADPMIGAFWSEVAAQQGNADAQYILGTLYSEGIKPDAEQAFRWFSSAAVRGNPKAMHNLAIALLNGVGVAKDKASAVNWFVRAANLGYRDSAFDLGVLYERGDGVAQNSRTALYWYDNAASLGDRQAARRAALLRSNGLQSADSN